MIHNRVPTRVVSVLAVLASIFGNRIAAADEPSPRDGLSACEIVRMSCGELEALYRQGTAAPLPDGKLRGTAIVNPGSTLGPAASRSARLMWQGKVINGGCETASNKFFGVRSVRAKMSTGESWLDSKPAVVLDYSETSLVYANVRDEIRQVAPGLYLGMMYKRNCDCPQFRMFFLLEAPSCCE